MYCASNTSVFFNSQSSFIDKKFNDENEELDIANKDKLFDFQDSASIGMKWSFN